MFDNNEIYLISFNSSWLSRESEEIIFILAAFDFGAISSEKLVLGSPALPVNNT